jgi:serine/threonine protein kinase
MAVKQVEMITGGPVTKEFEALEKEIRMLSAFEHERIVKYYGSEKKEQSFSIFMEYMSEVRYMYMHYYGVTVDNIEY